MLPTLLQNIFMPKEHLKQRLDSVVLEKATTLAKELSEKTGVEITVGAIIEKAVNELYERDKIKKPDKK